MLMRIITRAWNMAENHHSSANIVYATCVSSLVIVIDICVHFKNSPLINLVFHLHGTIFINWIRNNNEKNNKKRKHHYRNRFQRTRLLIANNYYNVKPHILQYDYSFFKQGS